MKLRHRLGQVVQREPESRSRLQAFINSPYRYAVALGFGLVGLIYLPIRLVEFAMSAIDRSATLLMLGLVMLGCYVLWRQWGQLCTLKASSEDRWIGQSVMLMAITLFPFAWATSWTPTIVSMTILLGIAYSYWGVAFLRRSSLGIFLIVAGLLPNNVVLIYTLNV